jgi:hypothetical protein
VRFLDVMATVPERGELADATSALLAMPPTRAPRAEHLGCSKSQAQVADRDRVLRHGSDSGSQQGHLRWGIGQWVKDEAKRLRVVKRTDFALRSVEQIQGHLKGRLGNHQLALWANVSERRLGRGNGLPDGRRGGFRIT